jgi:uridine monophosphate synthetase
MPTFFELLEHRVQQADSLLCIGLDPHPADLLPRAGGQVSQAAGAMRDFCLRLIEACAPQAAAFKPNSAFFEALGPEGIAVLREVIAAVPAGIPVILDAKRGDIASTAEAYAQAAFETLGAQALTVNPYLGYDAVEPFLRDPERGVFLLCKTSNPGSGDLQDLPTGSSGRQLFAHVAQLAQTWNQHGNLGLVVGATHPAALREVRHQAPDLWILAPGIGAQGGDLRQALSAGLREDGLGLLAPVSRAISRASDPRQAAEELRQAFNHERQNWQGIASPSTLPVAHEQVALGLLEAGCVKFGQFKLKSGLISPIYIDLRRLISTPELLAAAARAYLPVLERLSFQRLAALPYAALPIGTAISLQGSWPLIYPRKEVKEYGTRAEIEGDYQPGERVVVIDDLATTGGSKFEAFQKLAAAGLEVKDVVVLIDRQSGAAEALDEAGVHLHAVFTLTQLLDIWETVGAVPADQIAAARQFLA